MKQLEFISPRQASRDRARHYRAFVASCIFHAFLVCLLVGLTFIYWSQLKTSNGSPKGGQTISLPTLVIVAPPPEILSPAPQPPPQEKPPPLTVSEP
ncbi:MAG TPA: hypothetical protein VGC39_04605, partial [Candidatus Methylacidiphilales bacterium]